MITAYLKLNSAQVLERSISREHADLLIEFFSLPFSAAALRSFCLAVLD